MASFFLRLPRSTDASFVNRARWSARRLARPDTSSARPGLARGSARCSRRRRVSLSSRPRAARRAASAASSRRRLPASTLDSSSHAVSSAQPTYFPACLVHLASASSVTLPSLLPLPPRRFDPPLPSPLPLPPSRPASSAASSFSLSLSLSFYVLTTRLAVLLSFHCTLTARGSERSEARLAQLAAASQAVHGEMPPSAGLSSRIVVLQVGDSLPAPLVLLSPCGASLVSLSSSVAACACQCYLALQTRASVPLLGALVLSQPPSSHRFIPFPDLSTSTALTFWSAAQASGPFHRPTAADWASHTRPKTLPPA